MRLTEFLTEQTNASIIVVDIQKEYQKFIHFKIWDFCHFLNNQRRILYLYNGESLGMTSEDELKYFLLENELEEDTLDSIDFIDKGYAFLRGWMDAGIDEDIIIQALRHMDRRNINDSRDIEVEEWIELIPDLEDYSHIIDGDCINFPDIDKHELRRWNNSYICGGGRDECLKEVLILLEAFNIKTKPIQKFIY